MREFILSLEQKQELLVKWNPIWVTLAEVPGFKLITILMPWDSDDDQPEEVAGVCETYIDLSDAECVNATDLPNIIEFMQRASELVHGEEFFKIV